MTGWTSEVSTNAKVPVTRKQQTWGLLKGKWPNWTLVYIYYHLPYFALFTHDRQSLN